MRVVNRQHLSFRRTRTMHAHQDQAWRTWETNSEVLGQRGLTCRAGHSEVANQHWLPVSVALALRCRSPRQPNVELVDGLASIESATVHVSLAQEVTFFASQVRLTLYCQRFPLSPQKRPQEFLFGGKTRSS